MRRLAAFLFAASCHAAVPVQSEAFRAFYNLDYDRAISMFEEAARRSPNDPDALNHLAQGLLYRALYKGGALESGVFTMGNSFLRRPQVKMPPVDEKRFVSAITTSLRLTQQRLDKDKSDRAALYAQGVAYAHRAQFFLFIKKANLDALRDGTRSRKSHNRLLEVDGGHVDAKLIPGMHEYVVGSLPAWVKMLIFLAGFAGDKQKGIAHIEAAAREGQKTGVEARVLLSLVYSREKQPAKALPLVAELVEAFPENHLYRSEQALLLASAGRKEEALDAVARIESLKQQNHTHVRWMSREDVGRLRRNVEARLAR